ncbi:hypothetical protein ACEG43_44615 [Streptomyces aureus]|uniref:Transposase n=1 Tax=Streptomyces aureus TaxID=193461 RepID=A0ABV4SZD3_9ACTN
MSVTDGSASRGSSGPVPAKFFLSAFAALGAPEPRAYYDKKISQGKHHTQALLCLAGRRADVLYATLRGGTFYEPRPTTAVT